MKNKIIYRIYIRTLNVLASLFLIYAFMLLCRVFYVR